MKILFPDINRQKIFYPIFIDEFFCFRTTEQLVYIVTQMSRDSKSRHLYNKELETIFQT
jgi:hypothetical protein